MKHSLSFRFDRLFKLLRNEIRFNNRNFFLALGGLFAALTAIGFIISLDNGAGDKEFFAIWYFITLFGGGFHFTSISFRELNTALGKHQFLTLPASTLEKFVSKIILSTVGYVLIHLLCFYLFSWVLNGVISLAGEEPFSTFSIFNEVDGIAIFSYIKYYFIVQSIFLLGAVYFTKSELFKTLISHFLFSVIFIFITAILARLVFHDFFDGMSILQSEVELHVSNIEDVEGTVSRVIKGLRYPVYIAIPLLLWTIGFFKLKEKEA